MDLRTGPAGGPDLVARDRELEKLPDFLLECVRARMVAREREAFIAGLASGLEIARVLAMRR